MTSAFGIALLVDPELLVAHVAAHQPRHRRRVVGAAGECPREAVGDVDRLDREVGEPESELLVVDGLQQFLGVDRDHNWYLAGSRWIANCSSRSLSTLRMRMSSIGDSRSTEPWIRSMNRVMRRVAVRDQLDRPEPALGLDQRQEQLAVDLDDGDVLALPCGHQREAAPVQLLVGQPRLDPRRGLERLDPQVLVRERVEGDERRGRADVVAVALPQLDVIPVRVGAVRLEEAVERQHQVTDHRRASRLHPTRSVSWNSCSSAGTRASSSIPALCSKKNRRLIARYAVVRSSLVQGHRPGRRLAQPVAGIGVAEPQLVVPVRMGHLGRIKDVPDRVEQRRRRRPRMRDWSRRTPRVSWPARTRSVADWPRGDQVGDEPHELAHGDVTRPGPHQLQQRDQPLADLGLAQRVTIGDRRIGRVQPDVEPVLGQALDNPLDRHSPTAGCAG